MSEIALELDDLVEYRVFPLSALATESFPAYVRARVAQINEERIEEQGEEEAIGWCLSVERDIDDLVSLMVFSDQLADGGEEHLLLPGARLWMRQNEFDTSFTPVVGYPDPAWNMAEVPSLDAWVLSLVVLADSVLSQLGSSQEEVLYRGLIINRSMLREQLFVGEREAGERE
jgi:hypothetical protein